MEGRPSEAMELECGCVAACSGICALAARAVGDYSQHRALSRVGSGPSPWKTKCHDRGACLFSKNFFTAVARGQSPRNAFSHAKEQVALATRSGSLPNGLQGQVTAYEFRAPHEPSLYSCDPKPEPVGIPVLLSAEGEYYG